MRVEELSIPHPDGAVQVRFHDRLTVVAGLDAAARDRFVALVGGALDGDGPARALVRDDLGDQRWCGPGLGPAPIDGAGREAMVVGPAALGLDVAPPDPVVQAERTAVAMAHRELERELAALEAGAAERARLQTEAAGASPPPEASTGAEPGAGAGGESPDLDAVARAGPTIDELLRRRQVADDLLHHTDAILRSMDDGGRAATPAAGEPPPSGDPLGEGLRAAVDALRRVETGSSLVATIDRAQADRDARAAVRRALDELERARAHAAAEVETCDEALGAVAAAAGIDVGAGGPGAALTAALADRRAHVPPDAHDDPAARLLARRQAVLRARIHELPDEDEVEVTRRRLAAVSAKAASLDAAGRPDVARARAALLGRLATLRSEGSPGRVPLVLHEPFASLGVDERCDLLDLVDRVAERAQIVLLTGDPVAVTWARHRPAGGLRLIDLSRAG